MPHSAALTTSIRGTAARNWEGHQGTSLRSSDSPCAAVRGRASPQAVGGPP